MGQKAGFGKNTDKVMIDKIISGVNNFLIRKNRHQCNKR